MNSNQVIVRAPDGTVRTARPGQSVLFGRPGGGADLVVTDDVHLSRQHGVVEAGAAGWRLMNVSTVNPLFIDTRDGAVIPLRPGGRWDADRGLVAVGTAGMIHLERPLLISATVLPVRVDPSRLGLPEVSGEPTMPGAGVVLAEDAQYFLTAVLLCTPWLRDPLRIARLPTAAEIGLEAARLAGRPDPSTATLAELERFIVTDVKTLKQKMLDARVFTERPVSLGMLAAALIGHGLIGPTHVRSVLADAMAWRYRWRARLAVSTTPAGEGTG